MRNSVISRRSFIVGAAAGISPHFRATAAPLTDATLTNFGEIEYALGAWNFRSEHYAGIWSSVSGERGTKLNFRAHQVAPLPDSRHHAIAIGRRPGRQIVRFDYASAKIISNLIIEPYRTLNGHCLISADGSSFITSENDMTSGQGVLVFRSAESLDKYREIPSYGVGPHDMLADPDGKSIWVANGGILSIPDKTFARAPDAPFEMASSLVRIDLATGALIKRWELSDPFLSIRHIAFGASGEIGAALQPAHPTPYERSVAPVFALLTRDGRFDTVLAPIDEKLEGYGGDIAWSNFGETGAFAVGCSRANKISFWTSQGHFLNTVQLLRACAVSENSLGLFSIAESGIALQMNSANRSIHVLKQTEFEWDNHVSIIKARI